MDEKIKMKKEGRWPWICQKEGNQFSTFASEVIRNQRRAAWRQRQEERRQLEEEVNLKVKLWFKSITYIYDELIMLLLTCYKISDLSLKVLELLREEREREESLKKKPTWCTTCLELCLIG